MPKRGRMPASSFTQLIILNATLFKLELTNLVFVSLINNLTLDNYYVGGFALFILKSERQAEKQRNLNFRFLI